MPRFFPFGILLSAALGGLFLMGCSETSAPSPSRGESAELHASPSSASRFGTFNLQKRHGLGAWEHQAGPSEQELLKTMSGLSGSHSSSRHDLVQEVR